MTKLVASAENTPVFTAVPKMLPYSMVYVQGGSGGPMVWSAGDSSSSGDGWWTPSMPSQGGAPVAPMAMAVTQMPNQQQVMQLQVMQQLQMQQLMQQNAMQPVPHGQGAPCQGHGAMGQGPTMGPVPGPGPAMVQQTQQAPSQMGQLQMQMGQQIQPAAVQLPLQPLQQNQLADTQDKAEPAKDLARRDRRKIINQSLPSPVIVEEPQPVAPAPTPVPGTCEEMDKAPGKRRRRKEMGKSESARFGESLRVDLENGGSKAHAAIAQMRGNVLQLAMESESSSRAVQMALKVAHRETATELSLELSGHIAEVALSLHGNHVLQRAIEVLPASKTHFIAEELQERASEVARNVFGCRIFCRLLEQSATYDATQELMLKVLKDPEDLVQHQFGRFVAQAILEHGLDHQRHTLAQALRGRVIDMAQHRNASHVIEKSLIYCSAVDRRALALMLLKQASHGEESGVEMLARTQYGGFVVKALLNLGGDIEQEARRQLSELRLGDMKAASKETRFVERLLKDLNYLEDEKPGDLQNRHRPRGRRSDR